MINGFDTANTFGSQGAGSIIIDRNDNYRAAATLTKIAGNHTVKFGGEFLRMTHNYAQSNTPSGIFNFDPSMTAGNGNNDPLNGYSTPVLSTIIPGVPTCYTQGTCNTASAISGSGATTIANPFPGGILPPPGRSKDYAQALLGQGIGGNLLNNPYGYAQQWNADIQRELGNGFLIDVAYAGSKGTHLPIDSPQLDQYLSMGQSLLQSVPNPYYGIVTAPGSSLAQPTVQREQLLLPYPQYTGVSFRGGSLGDSTYESLQVKAEKRFSGGNSILFAYTHAKLISNTDTITSWLEAGGAGGQQNWNNLRAEKSLASFDVPDRLVVSYVLDIPVGKGRKYLANANGFTNAVLGGWGVQGVTTVQSGFPLHITTNNNTSHSFNSGGQRPNVVLGCDAATSGSIQQRLNDYINKACFTQPADFTFGNEGRTDPKLRAPGIANWDFSAFKSFAITEKSNLQFRAEFFNIFNRVQFGYPGQSWGPNSSSFGVISSQINTPRLVQLALRFSF